MNPFVYRKLPYDPLRDLVPVTQTATNTFALIVTPSLPVKSVKALVALGKARPGLRESRERMVNDGADPVGSTPEQFAAFVKAEAAKWLRVIRQAGLEHTQ